MLYRSEETEVTMIEVSRVFSYRNVVVHDAMSGTLATTRKEEIQRQIELQQALGTQDLQEEDNYLLEINLEDLERSSGERQEYWMLAIQAARKAGEIARAELEVEGEEDDTSVGQLPTKMGINCLEQIPVCATGLGGLSVAPFTQDHTCGPWKKSSPPCGPALPSCLAPALGFRRLPCG